MSVVTCKHVICSDRTLSENGNAFFVISNTQYQTKKLQRQLHIMYMTTSSRYQKRLTKPTFSHVTKWYIRDLRH